jgi:8-oxo-dGTP pyrophosphatase MutT (NUDIX family)
VSEVYLVYVGETDQEALARELQEELQVRCRVGAYVGVGTVANSLLLASRAHYTTVKFLIN